MRKSLSFIVVVLCIAASYACAGTENSPTGGFDKQSVMIPVRDGTLLNTEIYTPHNARGSLPILITRTPYGQNHDDRGTHLALTNRYTELADDGYIFVFQDIRGRYGSEGQFVMLRRPRDGGDPDAIDEGTDTWDTIDWLLENTGGHNGRVGILGVSYDGWLTVMAMIEAHPAVAAVSPQASPADMYIGDDFLHNGAFRLAASFGYVALMETGKTNQPFDFGNQDVYDWYLELGPLSNANERYFNGAMPTWNDFMANSNYTEYWKRQSVSQYLTDVTIPTLNVAGWWDAEDFYGPMKIYDTLEQYDTDNKSFLVAGPWRHGGWAGGTHVRTGSKRLLQGTTSGPVLCLLP